MRCAIHKDRDALFNCYLCKNPICVDCESKLRGQSICATCLGRIRGRKAAEIEAETKHLNVPSACAMGAVAAGLGAFAWSQFVLMTSRPLDILAVVLGALVAYGVMKGAGGKRGDNLQQISSVLALGSILIGHFLILVRARSTAYAGVSAGGAEFLGALYAFPGYLSEMGAFGWVCLLAGTVLAYWLPHPRALVGDGQGH
ncbi:MAG: B-box zinc finger protein [Armatimonadota bacterium]